MPQIATDQAIVLRTVEYGERDIIVTLLGRETGKFSAIAKGGKASRKRFPGALDLFRVSEVTFRTRRSGSMSMLTEATVLGAFKDLDGSFDKIAVASYYTELVREMVQEGEDGEQAFDRAVEFYALVDAAADDPSTLELLLAQGVLRWLGHSGLAPSLAGCYRCSVSVASTDRAWFFSQQGEGALCSRCRTHGHRVWSVSPQALTLMAGLDSQQERGLAAAGARTQVRKVLLGLARCTLGRELKSRTALDLVFDSDPAGPR
jgi:DNA repair protein RecO (recombination protein O)